MPNQSNNSELGEMPELAGLCKWIETEVNPKDLLLDPNNIRIVLSEEEMRSYPNSKTESDQLQSQLYKQLLNNSEFDVAGLITRIKSTGWQPEGGFYVEYSAQHNKYLVLEGNRRTTAIKYILNNPGNYSNEVIKSLQRIKVQKLKILDKNNYDYIKRILVSTRNMGSVKDFSPMHKAFNAYLVYKPILEKKFGEAIEFHYDQPSAKRVAEQWGETGHKIKKWLGVYNVYSQLKNQGYSVTSDHYTLIDLAIYNGILKTDYYGYDSEVYLSMSPEGLERFSNLCIDPVSGTSEPPIHEPKLVRKFSEIFKSGFTKIIREVEQGATTIEDAHDLITLRNQDSGIVSDLENIHEKLKNIPFQNFKNTPREKELILKLNDFLSFMLWGIDEKNNSFKNSLSLITLTCKNLLKSNFQDVKSFALKLHNDITQFKKKIEENEIEEEEELEGDELETDDRINKFEGKHAISEEEEIGMSAEPPARVIRDQLTRTSCQTNGYYYKNYVVSEEFYKPGVVQFELVSYDFDPKLKSSSEEVGYGFSSSVKLNIPVISGRQNTICVTTLSPSQTGHYSLIARYEKKI
tara:strand:+ start:690 stop:2420 length:1731 start_codon:yes stop_codon:yes gene_type:complete